MIILSFKSVLLNIIIDSFPQRYSRRKHAIMDSMLAMNFPSGILVEYLLDPIIARIFPPVVVF